MDIGSITQLTEAKGVHVKLGDGDFWNRHVNVPTLEEFRALAARVAELERRLTGTVEQPALRIYDIERGVWVSNENPE